MKNHSSLTGCKKCFCCTAKPTHIDCIFYLLLEISLVRRIIKIHIFFLDKILSELLPTYDNEYKTLGTLNKAMSTQFQGDHIKKKLFEFKCDTSVGMLNICFPDHVSLEPSVLKEFSLFLFPP